MNSSNVRALILAAGRGSRMGDMTSNQPKCFTTLGGRRLIDWQIAALEGAGIREIGIVTGYKKESFQGFNLKEFHNREWRSTNMVASLLAAEPFIDRTVIVSYSDIVYQSVVVDKLMNDPHEVTLAYDKNWLSLWSARFQDPLSDAESFRIDNNGRVKEIGSSNTSVEQIQGQYMGLFKISPIFMKTLRYTIQERGLDLATLDMTAALSILINSGLEIYGVPSDSGWCEIDSVSDIEVALKLIESGRLEVS